MKDAIKEALFQRSQGISVTLVVVTETKGSTPRHAGATMLVSPSGRVFGTIGGGAVELAATENAMIMDLKAVAFVETHHLVRDLAMCCGGSMTLLYLPIEAHEKALREWTEQPEPKQLSLVVPLGGAAAHLVDYSKSAESIPHGQDRIRLDGDAAVVMAPEIKSRLLLFGGGHVAKELGALALKADFEVIICDDDETGALCDWADSKVVCIPSFTLSDVLKTTGPLTARDHLIILTRDHSVDQQILESTLPYLEDVAYVGVIGSRGKIARFQKRLIAKGKLTQKTWNNIHGPIGIDIGAETPLEIAISVMAELISIRARKRL